METMLQMKKKIGILGGFSYESTIQYYDNLMRLYYEQFHDYYYPELVIYSMDFQKFTDMEDENRMDDYRAYILESIHALKAAGVDFVAMSANSPHSVYDDIAPQAGLPMISIVESVGNYAVKHNMKKVLLTGIKYTMNSTFYPKGLAKLGVEVIVPSDADKDEINHIIFDELCIGNFKDSTRERFKEIISAYEADGVILGCTELPLLLHQEDTDIPLISSVDVHCKAIIDYTLSQDT